MKAIEKTYAEMKEPYEVIRERFGIYNLELSLNTTWPRAEEEYFTFPEYVGKDIIQQYLVKDMDLASGDIEKVIEVLWLNANLNYSNNNAQAEEEMMLELGEEQIAWPSIKEDLLRLALFLKSQDLNYKPLQIKIGKKQSLEIQNSMSWFTRVFEHQCLDKVFGSITIEEIKDQLKAIDKGKEEQKKRKEHEIREKRRCEKAIACGLSEMFLEKGLIKVAGDAGLVKFTKDYLYLMEFIGDDEHDSEFFNENIRQWINNARGRYHRLKSLPAPVLCTIEDLAPTEDDKQRKRLLELAFPRV